MVIVFIGLSSSVAAQIPIVRGQLHPPAHELAQGLFVIMEEVSTHTEPQTRSLWLRPIRIGPRSRVDVRGDGSCGVPMAAG